ncbi:MAG: YdiU family protein [Planctomycetaceae bacterium]|nr:YdiU family protein [Planctomycetaceae bacterium]
MKTLESLEFSNRFSRELPADHNSANSRRQVHYACYSRVSPTPVSAPSVVSWSREVAADLDLPPEECERPLFAELFGGNRLLDGMDPFAMCYGGHQFGNWAGQLGDGRAINLGEVRTSTGYQTLQLKGAGPTPYSRTADGLAVLRSSVREYLCSEAMHHLGVPTTRALSLVLTGEKVRRDMFYDGNPQWEPGAVVCRVAPSFTRFGNFQIFASRKDPDTLKQLVEFTIRSDFPHLLPAHDGPLPSEIVTAWFDEVCQRTAAMIVHWQRVGFVHGVMNTDNMSILGLTIDYGPYGWLEGFDRGWTPNTTDAQGRRYRFGNQPVVAHWNLYQLANAIVQMTEDPKPLEQSLEEYANSFNRGFYEMMTQKLGLSKFQPDGDQDLVDDVFDVLSTTETDMTIFFRNLAQLPHTSDPVNDLPACLSDALYVPEEFTGDVREAFLDWLNRYRLRIVDDGLSADERSAMMNAANPKYVLRNYMAQVAIDQLEEGRADEVNRLLELLRHPYDEQPEHEQQYFARRPEWARERAGCSMLSCSS